MPPEKQQFNVRIWTGFLGGATLLFIGLKMRGYIIWSWLWVISPLWMPFAFLTMLIFLVAVLSAAADIEER